MNTSAPRTTQYPRYGTVPLLSEEEIQDAPYPSTPGSWSQGIFRRVVPKPKFSDNVPKYAIDPRVLLPKNKALQVWDMVVSVALVWTATGTVYDVCVIQTLEQHRIKGAHESGEILIILMHGMSVLLDLVFICDTIITFFRAFRYKHRKRYLETNLVKIQRHYLFSTNFIVDLLSSIPFDVIIKICRAHNIKVGRYRFLRLLRLLRLARMVRMIEQSNMWQQFQLEVNSATMSLCWLGSLMVLVNHWFACLMVFVAREEGIQPLETFKSVDNTWLDEYIDKMGSVLNPDSDFEVYVLALYWGVATVTSIGYGDVRPVNLVEYIVTTVLMFVGGFLWTYIIGQVSGIVIVMEHQKRDRRDKMDAINSAIAEVQSPLDKTTIQSFRSFVHRMTHSAGYALQTSHLQSLHLLSPALQNTLLVAFYRPILDRIGFLRRMPKSVLASLAKGIQTHYFSRGEVFNPLQLVPLVDAQQHLSDDTLFEPFIAVTYVNQGVCLCGYNQRSVMAGAAPQRAISPIDQINQSDARIATGYEGEESDPPHSSSFGTAVVMQEGMWGEDCMASSPATIPESVQAGSFVELMILPKKHMLLVAKQYPEFATALKFTRIRYNMLHWARSVNWNAKHR